jgi:hypothetical protein
METLRARAETQKSYFFALQLVTTEKCVLSDLRLLTAPNSGMVIRLPQKEHNCCK